MFTRTATLLLALSIPAVSPADEHEDRFVAQMRAAIQEREEQREELESHLKELQAGRVNRRMQQREIVTEARGRKRYVWNSPEAKEKAVAEVQAKIDRLGAKDSLIPTLAIGNLNVGDIGKLPEVVENYEYVFSAGESVALPRHTTFSYHIRQVIDDGNALVEQRRYDHEARLLGTRLIWLVGPTSGLADGAPLKISESYQVTGTRQYETAAGSSNTVYVLKPVDVQPLIEQAKQPAPRSR